MVSMRLVLRSMLAAFRIVTASLFYSTELVTSSKDVYRNNTAEEGGGVFLNCTAHGQSVYECLS